MAGPSDALTDALSVDPEQETERIVTALRTWLAGTLRRRGAVVALSGGIDSSVVGALCVRAIGPERVFGLLLPERESSQTTRELGQLVADHLGIKVVEQDITTTLESVGCYQLRDEAIRSVVPEYGPEYKCKIVLPSLLGEDQLRFFSVVVQAPEGRTIRARLPHGAYLSVVAASNFKQRMRKVLEYHWAERLNYAVMGTPNRLEYDQGFFVKGGDGLADAKPIAHLYKTQVYQLAEQLGVPPEIIRQPPTTDTYSLAQTQEEFYFSLPHDQMDLCLYGRDHEIPAAQVAAALDRRPDDVERVYRDIDQKRRTTRYLHLPPLLVDPVFDDSL